MPAPITIPISIFELTVHYEKPEIRLMAERAVPLRDLFTALAPANPNVDDVEVITTGKNSEQGVKLRLPTLNITFFFGPTLCRFTKEAANWSEADDTLAILALILETFSKSAAVTYAKRSAVLALHLQLATVSYKDILRRFMSPSILQLEEGTPDIMAVVTRWPKRGITLDGSASYANALFLRTEREFDAGATFEEMKEAIRKDQLDLFTLLDVEEAQS